MLLFGCLLLVVGHCLVVLVACCVLCVGCCSFVVVFVCSGCCELFVVVCCSVVFVLSCSSSVVRCLRVVAGCNLIVRCRLSFDVWLLLFVIFCWCLLSMCFFV